jgi:hypothetical protein
MLDSAIAAPELVPSPFGPPLPKKRATDLKEIVSLPVRELFEDIAPEIYVSGDNVAVIRQHTEKALADVDMSMIKPDDKVNLLCSEHGFALMGGFAYAEMIKTIKDVVLEKTGNKNIRLRFCVGEKLEEARQMIPQYGLDKHFDKIVSTWPFDKGQAIETEIGTLFGLKRVYDADWIIHTCYSDPREVWYHRGINRILKTFTMAYARYETRSAYHMAFASRSSNIIPRAIFDSPFVQERFAFVCTMETSPAGITGILADTDLYRVNGIITKNTLTSYGKLTRLLTEINECVVILDGQRWPVYIHGGGLVSGNLYHGKFDYFNLDLSGRSPDEPHHNPALKALVVNYSWAGALAGLAILYPTFVAGEEIAKGLPFTVSKYGTVTEDLESALSAACEKANTDKIIVFDGSFGRINVSRSMGKYLLERAPHVSKEVDEELMPMWLSQRGLTA